MFVVSESFCIFDVHSRPTLENNILSSHFIEAPVGRCGFDLRAFFIMNTINNSEVEVWKDVVGFEDYYEVSNTGKVRRKKGKTVYKDGRIARFSQTVLKPSVFKKGYLMVFLSVKSKKKAKSVHRIVAEAFIPNPENKETVNHIDCDKTNNHVSNLEWMTNRENTIHGTENGLFMKAATTRRKKKQIKKNGDWTSQYVGVSYDNKKGKWLAQITHNWKHIYIGYYNEEEDASEAYQKKLKELEDEIIQLPEKNSRIL